MRFGELVGETWDVATTRPAASLVTLAALLAAGVASDHVGPGGNVVFGVVQLVAQWAYTRVLLDRAGRLDGAAAAKPTGGVFALLGLGIMSGICILLGFVLLIVPGVYLAARWSAATPYLATERAGPGVAMRASWDATREHALPIMLALVVVSLPPLVLFGAVIVVAATTPGDLAPSTLEMVLTNAALAAFTLAQWALAVAVFLRVARPGTDRLAELFA